MENAYTRWGILYDSPVRLCLHFKELQPFPLPCLPLALVRAVRRSVLARALGSNSQFRCRLFLPVRLGPPLLGLYPRTPVQYILQPDPVVVVLPRPPPSLLLPRRLRRLNGGGRIGRLVPARRRGGLLGGGLPPLRVLLVVGPHVDARDGVDREGGGGRRCGPQLAHRLLVLSVQGGHLVDEVLQAVLVKLADWPQVHTRLVVVLGLRRWRYELASSLLTH